MACPALTPVTIPEALIVALLVDVHVTLLTAPVAVSCIVLSTTTLVSPVIPVIVSPVLVNTYAISLPYHTCG